VLVAVVASASAAGLEPAPLQVARSAAEITIAGEHFALTWSAAKGGDLTSIRLHDGAEWHELVGQGARRTSVPGLLIYTTEGTLGPFATATLTVTEESPERAVIFGSSRLATEAGVPSALELHQTFTVYREGAVFVDVTLELPAGSAPLAVRKASLGWPVETASYTLQFWHWQRDPRHGSGFLDPQPTFSGSFCPNAGLALGTAGGISNQLQVIVESSRGIDGSASNWIKDGHHFITWLRGESPNPAELVAPYHYRNRWGFFLGRSPEHSRLTGPRLAYWVEGGETAMAFPSAGAIDAMARCGASAIVLGEGWRRAGGRDGNVPVDEAAFGEFVRLAHAAGIKCLVTTVPGGDGEALGRWARQAGLDGLYLVQASAHYAAIADSAAEYPAQATFAWGKALRRGLGDDALLIVHTGLEAPDMTLGLLSDGVAFGTERVDWRASRSTLASDYLGGAGFARPCPLGLADPMKTAQAAAIAAATGAVPMVAIGQGPLAATGAERSAYVAAAWALPLWQLLRLVEPGPEVSLRRPGTRAAAATSNVDFWSSVYRLSDDAALLLTGNLSRAVKDSTAIAVDFDALGFDGEYTVEHLTADSIEGYGVRYLGHTANGRIRTESIPRYGVRGFLFIRGEHSPAIARALDEGLQVSSALSDQRPPDPVAGLQVTPVTAGLELAWSPVADNHHVARYRIYRSADPGFKQARETLVLGEAYEETRARDLAVSPGERWSYVVTAVDVAGNEGRPSPAVRATVPAGERSFSFSDSAAARRTFVPQAGSWTVHDSAYGHGCTPDATRLATSLLAGVKLADVDLAVKITSPAGGPVAGGLLCRSNTTGEGYALCLGEPVPGTVVLARIDGGKVRPLATAYYPFVTARTATHTLRLVARGEELAGYCDDRLLVSATDSTYAGGQVGLVAMQGHVHFDNLTLNAPGAVSGAGERIRLPSPAVVPSNP